ncbi:hypothetical protein DJ71_10530, partial [Halorubrum sp. E3]
AASPIEPASSANAGRKPTASATMPTALGVVRTLLMGAGALAPSAVGIVADAVGFRPAFALLAGSMGLAAVVAAGLWVTE